MNRIILAFLIGFSTFLSAQTIKSPSEFFGVALGEEFHLHHQVIDYYNYLAEVAPDRVKVSQYGKTYEKRPLLLVYVSSASNLSNLENIRKEHLNNINGSSSAKKAIAWLSYNVHGNESVSTEASMLTIYKLLTENSDYLNDVVVIMDPCINPDGRDRYVTWYNQNKNEPFNVDPNSVEHHEGWLTGRPNHYMFDLNRDWAWLTQIESQQRIKLYNQWLPHIHVDFHEQGVDAPYYFAPAAEPYNEVISEFQRNFQMEIGKNHARYFDEKGWLYFTKEVFDLLYPSYGDTYPTYNGSIGMTYEQGGSGRAGLGVITSNRDTLTLKDRIAHHTTTGLSTVEMASKNAERLNTEFRKYYTRNDFSFKNYVLSGEGDKIDLLSDLLDQHEIKYIKTNEEINGKGLNFETGKTGSFKQKGDQIVITSDQTKQNLIKVLFEPSAKLTDSVTYDITAWSLPYAYGLNAFASEKPISVKGNSDSAFKSNVLTTGAYAYIADWNSMKDARFLSELIKEKIKVRYSNEPFTIEGESFHRGSLIVTKLDNSNTEFISKLEQIANKHKVKLKSVKTGFVDKGKDFGSDAVTMIKPAKVAILRGEPTSTLSFGEIWHYFEQQLGYPVSVLDTDYLSRVDLSKYDVLVLPDGSYGSFMDEKQLGSLKDWVGNGGRLIAISGAVKGLEGEKGFGIKSKKSKKDSTSVLLPYAAKQREGMKKAITGAIFKIDMDPTHPLAYGYGSSYYSLKNNEDTYTFLKSGNVGYIQKETKPLSGFAGSSIQTDLENTLVFGVENYKRGSVVYLIDNPLFRGFWENGKLLFANAIFMVP
ncbi:M14 family metallopeptidase [Namhaeicola litoreus]|uniref:M14 family metallopeptidase n=1 Tax=Namhaeicola litoreus TaxID=1052145 RepID=A0ABW3XZN5_9FLAO